MEKTVEQLVPKFEVGKLLRYRIFKKETFRFMNSESKPFERHYTIEIRILSKTQLEVYYPDSFLSASKHFNSFDKHLDKITGPQNSTLFIRIDDSENLELENIKAIQSSLIATRSILIKNAISPQQKEFIKGQLDYLSEEEKIKDFFLEDLNYLFEYWGVDKKDGIYIDAVTAEDKSKIADRKE